MTVVPIRLGKREVAPHKAIIEPQFGLRTVLTNSPWEFAGLWLKRQGAKTALFYWEQARQFYRASEGLPPQSAPLPLYYCYMNAAKALLEAKGIKINPYHGVTRWQKSGNSRGIHNQGIEIRAAGILPLLSQYYRETEPNTEHTLQELFFNMSFIHRTYCLTYVSQKEMFLPLKDCRYVLDRSTNRLFLRALIATDAINAATLHRLPPSFIPFPDGGKGAIRSSADIPWKRVSGATAAEIAALKSLHADLRMDLHYITGAQTLWYVKLSTPGPARLSRRPATLVLGAMHRLSEICRYTPLDLQAYLDVT